MQENCSEVTSFENKIMGRASLAKHPTKEEHENIHFALERCSPLQSLARRTNRCLQANRTQIDLLRTKSNDAREIKYILELKNVNSQVLQNMVK